MKLVKIDNQVLSIIESQWDKDLDEFDAVHPARCRGAIARAKDCLDTKADHNVHPYAVIDSSEGYEAIILLSHAMPNTHKAWLKMLELTLRPRYAADGMACDLDNLIDIGACVIADLYDLSSDEHKSDKIKIYGDSLMDARIWRAVAKRIDAATVPFELSHHGQWLVLS